MAPPPHEPVCFIVYLGPGGETGVMLEIPDELADFARSKGWHVLARDSDMPNGPSDLGEPMSGPRRCDE